MKRTLILWCLVLATGWVTAAALPQDSVVTGGVKLFRADGSERRDNDAGIVVSLTPLARQPAAVPRTRNANPPMIIQRNKRFLTRVLAVEVGSLVEFPNKDPFFHNVFSLFEGKRFDLGLYEANSTKSVRFDHPGVSYIFCNIHSQMSAAVVVVNTPYFVQLSTPGDFKIPRVPPGRYELGVWAERVSPETLKKVSRQILVEGVSSTLETIHLRESAGLGAEHSNKYGKSYETPVFSSPIYAQP